MVTLSVFFRLAGAHTRNPPARQACAAFTAPPFVTSNMHILIACGGTGGHLFPGIAVAEELLRRGHHATLLISEKSVDAEASAKYPHLDFRTLPAVAKPPTLSPRMVGFLWRMRASAQRCQAILRETGARTVLGMGGFTSLPPVHAGRRAGCRTFIHDSNARPGRANVLTSRFCDEVLLGMEAASPFFPGRTIRITGTPVRPEISTLPPRAEAAARLGLDPDKTTILVTGGSQGARRLNDLAAAAATHLPDGWQVLHIAGAADAERVRQLTTQVPGYQVLGFCDQMPDAYAVADLLVARAGASSLCEIAQIGLPSLLIPYPHAADDHQTRNAEVFQRAGASRLLPEPSLDAPSLNREILAILQDLPTYKRMCQASRSLAVPDAAARICDALEAAHPSP